jgi:D-lactate dehydrogenase (cytochrome)
MINSSAKTVSRLFFPIDPGADATLGGMCLRASSLYSCVDAMRKTMLALEVVTSGG